MPRNGMVTVKGSPVSGFDVIGPSNGGKPIGVDHGHAGRAGLLAEDRTRDASAGAPKADRQLAGRAPGLLVGRHAASERLVLTRRCGIVLEDEKPRLVPVVTAAPFALIARIGVPEPMFSDTPGNDSVLSTAARRSSRRRYPASR